MECFIGRELNSTEIVHHIDGNKQNNNISNLEILTRSEHAKKHYNEIGYKNQFKKKYDIDINELKLLYQDVNMTFKKLSIIYGCSIGTIEHLLGKNARKEIKCRVCNKKADYIKKQLCKKCYLREYYEKNK